nr:transmembrane protein 199-like isoform X1 [Leptinotarsa decemlineata]XP_023021227.1 transmembrane protein 199-like isoform X1 [Leptinotarsa decemlineata]
MATNTAPISNPNIFIKPSHKLTTYIGNMKIAKDLPPGLSGIVFKTKVKYKEEPISAKMDYLVTDEDREFIKLLNMESTSELYKNVPFKDSSTSSTDKLLSLQDLFWLYEYIQKENEVEDEKVYLHELIDGSDIILPKNEEIPRNKELDKRCRQLKAEQENRDYNKMTKNVDSKRKRFPDDTIAYQSK